MDKKEYFPLFINVTGQVVTVIGCGKIATRRIRTLLQFGCKIKIISPNFSEDLQDIEIQKALSGKPEQIIWIPREYQEGDCNGSIFVVTATDEREINHAVAMECKKLQIPVSVADRKEESTFYFPGVAIEDTVVVGVTASGEDHTLAKRVTLKIRSMLDTVVRHDMK